MNESSTTNRDKSLTIILPVYRNEASVAELTQRLIRTCAPMRTSLRLLFIDDASPDNASAVIRELQHTYKGIELIRHKTNQGQQEAIRTGLKSSNSDYVAVMDADLQDPPEMIPKLYQAIFEQQTNAIFAIRSNHYQSIGRMSTSRIFKWLMGRMVNLPKGAGCFVFMDRKTVSTVLSFHTRGFYLPGLICKTDLKIGTLDCERNLREHGQSAYTPTMRLKTAISNIKCLLE